MTVHTVWRGREVLDVPEGWEWDGTLGALLEFSDLDASGVELVDWEVTE